MKIDINQKELNKIKNEKSLAPQRINNNTYFFLENTGLITEAGGRNSEIALKRKRCLNYFETFEDCYKHLKKLNRKAKTIHNLE